MSKPTSQDIIDSGSYLEPFFDPSALLVANLRAILQHHDIQFPANATKVILIKHFNQNIAPNAQELRRQKKTADGMPSDASDILDAETGEYLESKPATRRVGRRSTRGTAATSANASPVRNASRTKRRRTTITPKPEVVSDEEIKKDEGTPKKGRRISRNWGPGDETSMWTDENPFQSGRDSSLVKQDRPRSTSPRKPRKSARMSAVAKQEPVQYTEYTVPIADPGPSTPPTKVIRSMPLATQHTPVRNAISTKSTPVKVEQNEHHGLKMEDSLEYEDEVDPFSSQERIDAEAVELANTRVAHKIATLTRKARGDVISSTDTFPTWLKFVLGMASILILTMVGQYKNESVAIGYCDTGSSTNSKIQARLELQKEIKECQQRALQNSTDGKVHHNLDAHCNDIIPFVPLPLPTTCTPCPDHAKCLSKNIVCEPAYVLKQHALASVPLLSGACNGLPGLGPIAFPPRCVPDSRRRKNVSAISKTIESVLARVRGDRVCVGVQRTKGGQSGAAAFGLSLEKLRSVMIDRAKGNRSLGDFEDIFGQALAELKSKSLVITGRDAENLYYASIREEMTYGCKARVIARDAWRAYKMNLLYLALALGAIAAGRSKMTARAIENRRVRALVKDALETLQAKEAAHYIDPVQTPSPSIASLQLRDLVMQDEHSIPVRARVWEQVERVVEGNANVRTNMEELSGGDEGRVWKWIGSANSTARRLKFAEGQASAPGRPVV